MLPPWRLIPLAKVAWEMPESTWRFEWENPRFNEDIRSGWWLSHPSEKYEFISWDDDIPNIYVLYIHIYGKTLFITTNQLLDLKTDSHTTGS